MPIGDGTIAQLPAYLRGIGDTVQLHGKTHCLPGLYQERICNDLHGGPAPLAELVDTHVRSVTTPGQAEAVTFRPRNLPIHSQSLTRPIHLDHARHLIRRTNGNQIAELALDTEPIVKERSVFHRDFQPLSRAHRHRKKGSTIEKRTARCRSVIVVVCIYKGRRRVDIAGEVRRPM